MSFITRCPACSTSFKVVADQLRVSQGWVRCGHCAEIFDANQDIKPWVPTPPVLTSVVDEQPQVSGQVWASHQSREGASASSNSPFDGVLDGLAELSEWQHQRHGSADEPHLTDDWSVRPHHASVDQDPVLHIDVLQADNDELLNAVPQPEPAPEPQPEPQFLKQARRQAFWSSRGVRVALWTGVCLSTMVLVLQWAIHDRHRLVAWQPAIEPWLTVLCQPLGCRIEPVRQLDAVVIDSSGLVRLLGQLHALDVELKNTQDWPVAMPSFELSLTDAQDQVLVRRVFLAKDWPDAPQVLTPGQAWPVKLRLSIALSANQTMAGYRIALFYP